MVLCFQLQTLKVMLRFLMRAYCLKNAMPKKMLGVICYFAKALRIKNKKNLDIAIGIAKPNNLIYRYYTLTFSPAILIDIFLLFLGDAI